jgi:hypothetical protein
VTTYYFDSAAGNDANTGLSWEQAWSGASTQIATYIASGNIIWLKGSWTNQVLGTFTGLSNFELRVHADGAVLDCRTRHDSGWSNVSSSKVWKKTYAHQVHRLFLGSDSVHGFTEGSDAAKKVVQGTYAAGSAASDAEAVTALNTASVDQSRFWYWDAISDTLYVRSTDSSTDPDTAYGGVWTCDGSDSSSADRRRWQPFRFVDCTGLYFGPVEVRGAVHPLQLENSSGTIEPYLTDFPHYQWPTLTCKGAASGAGTSLVINNPQIFCRRPYFADDIMQVQSFDDGNGYRNQGGADLIVISSRWASWQMIGGHIDGGIHGCVSSQYYHGAYVTDGLIQGTYFDMSNQRYGRGLNLQQAATGRITSFVIENCTFNGQNILSQVMWDNTTIRNCIWRHGRFGWFGDGTGPNVVDKYHPTYDWKNRWRNSGSIHFYVDGSAVVASNMVLEDCIFYGQYDEPISLDSGRVISTLYIRDNWFIRVAGDAGTFGQTVVKNYSSASASYSGNKWSGYTQLGYTTISSGFSEMSAGELTTYAARAKAQTIALSPTSLSVAVGASDTSTLTVTDVDAAAVSDWTGVVSSSDTGVATTGLSGTTLTVTGVGAGSATADIAGVAGSLTKSLPVTVTADPPSVGQIEIIQSKIETATATTSVSVTLDSAPTSGNLLVVFVGGFVDTATAITVSDNRSNTYTEQELVTNGSTGIHAGVWTCPPSTVTAPFTVTATPASGTNHFISICVLEIDNQSASPVNQVGSATGTGTAPYADMPVSTALRVLVLGGVSWLFGGDGSTTGNVATAGSTYTMEQKRDRSAGLAVVSRYATVLGKYDPQVTLAISDQWAGVGIYIAEIVPSVSSGRAPIFRRRKKR